MSALTIIIMDDSQLVVAITEEQGGGEGCYEQVQRAYGRASIWHVKFAVSVKHPNVKVK